MEKYQKNFEEPQLKPKRGRKQKNAQEAVPDLDVDGFEEERASREKEARDELARLYVQSEVGPTASHYIKDRLGQPQHEPLTKEEEVFYTNKFAEFKKVSSGDSIEEAHKIKKRLIEANQRLVASIAGPIHWNLGVEAKARIDFSDLMQEGTIGLAHAIDKFDPQRGLKLSTYATWWIWQAVTRYTEHSKFLVAVPAHIMEDRAKVLRLVEEANREGKSISVEELSVKTGLSLEKVDDRLNPAPGVVWLDSMSLDGEESNKHDYLTNQADSPLEHVVEVSNRETIALWMDKAGLDPREKLVLTLRFGLEGREDLSLRKVATEMAAIYDEKPVSGERVRQIQTAAFKKLKRYYIKNKRKGKNPEYLSD